jgi:hypothetical protein
MMWKEMTMTENQSETTGLQVRNQHGVGFIYISQAYTDVRRE